MEIDQSKCSDEQIIQLIKTLIQKDGNEAVQCIYKVYGKSVISTLKHKISPSKEELINDILTDAILALINAIRQRRFELRDSSSIRAYLNRTARNLLNQEFRTEYKNVGQQKAELDRIDKYILNKMTAEEKEDFIQQLANNPHLQEEVELRRQMNPRKWRMEALNENVEVEVKKELEHMEEMKRLIGQLTPLQQELLTAHYHNEIGLSTYAEMRNMSPEAVRQQHHRCLKKLRELFNQYKSR